MSTTERPPTERSERNAPGRNGVEIARPLGGVGGFYRSYEVYQRQRVQQSTYLVHPRFFSRPEFLRDPYPTLKLIRENYPFLRDWVSNCDWVTAYNDVTSIFVDDANFETRTKLWFYGMAGWGRDLGQELPVLSTWTQRIDACIEPVARKLASDIRERRHGDLVDDFTNNLDLRILCDVLDLPAERHEQFAAGYRAMHEGWQWHPRREEAGRAALADLAAMFAPLLEERRQRPGDDLISAVAALDLADGPAQAEDLVATLLEADGDSLRASLANMWCLLLTHPDQLADVRGDAALIKRAWQESIRHSAPIVQARRFARHEVERFGRLIPEGGMLICSAAAANRDATVFSEPDRFDVHRTDLCFREARGQYRADGLPSGISFGTGKPSKFPAIPEDRPRSWYAVTRDAAVTASRVLIELLPGLRLADGAAPALLCRWPGDSHTCWDLAVEV